MWGAAPSGSELVVAGLDGQVLQSADLPQLAARLRQLGVGAAPWLWPGLAR